jgi:hypothetical protein
MDRLPCLRDLSGLQKSDGDSNEPARSQHVPGVQTLSRVQKHDQLPKAPQTTDAAEAANVVTTPALTTTVTTACGGSRQTRARHCEMQTQYPRTAQEPRSAQDGRGETTPNPPACRRGTYGGVSTLLQPEHGNSRAQDEANAVEASEAAATTNSVAQDRQPQGNDTGATGVATTAEPRVAVAAVGRVLPPAAAFEKSGKRDPVTAATTALMGVGAGLNAIVSEARGARAAASERHGARSAGASRLQSAAQPDTPGTTVARVPRVFFRGARSIFRNFFCAVFLGGDAVWTRS